MSFNRGTDNEHPHFKNWPSKQHDDECPVPNPDHFINIQDRAQITTLISTILTNAKKLEQSRKTDTSGIGLEKRLIGSSTRKMIYQLSSLTNEKFVVLPDCADLDFQTEDGKKVKIKDLILTQDEAIDRLNSTEEPFIGIVRGAIGNPFKKHSSGYGYQTFLSTNTHGTYGNKNKFKLYIPNPYVDPNIKRIATYQHCKILCYGEVELFSGVPQMKIYSIYSQMVRGLIFSQ